MKDSKVDKILMSAMKEFSKHGYKKTSINSIVEDAGVSKGLLFYHFKSKKDLYIYLVKYITEVYEKEVSGRFDLTVTDFIEMVKKTNRVKIELESKYPYSLGFYSSVLNEEVRFKELYDFIEESMKLSNHRLYEHILKNTDQSLFKDGVDIITALKVSSWVAKGYVEEGKFKDINSINENLDSFERLLRTLLYK